MPGSTPTSPFAGSIDITPKRKRTRTPNGYNGTLNGYDSPREPSEQESPRFQLAERPAQNQRSSDEGAKGPEDISDEHRHRYYRDSRSTSPPLARQRRRSTALSGAPSHAVPAPLPSTKPSALYYEPKLILRGHKRGVSAVKFSPDGRWIASCSADCTIKIWNANTGRHEHTLEGHLAGISALAWSPDSNTLASGSDDKSIRLWDIATGKPHPTSLLGHHNYVYSLAFSPKGNMLVSGSYDEAVFLWDVRTARVMRSLPAHSDPVGGVDFVRDGTLLVSCSGDGLIRIWDTATGQCLRTLVHEDNAPVTSVRFSPNGRFVLAWTLDSSIRLWNYIEGRCVKTYQGHKNEKYSIVGAFGTYGEKDDPCSFVVSGSEDGEVVMWDVSSKNVLQRMKGHEGVVLGVDAHPMEQAIVSCGLDRTVRVWRHAATTANIAQEGGLEGHEDASNGAVPDANEKER
ncbi:WD domain protein, partial [Cryomyces antarcticus]